MTTPIFIQTHGCSVNQHESEVMAGLLKQAEFDLVDNIEEAFVVILNVCTVKGTFKAVREINRILESYPNKKLVIAGCITKDLTRKLAGAADDCSMISTHNIREIVSVVEETINDNPVRLLAQSSGLKLGLPKVRKNKIIAIVPISEGCSGYCSYCSVKMVKGKLNSYPKEDIIKEIEYAVQDGCREIWITSQDNSSYGTDNNKESQLPELLNEISQIKGNFLVRVGMMNPNHALPVLDKMVDAFLSPKIFKFIHLPVQSGSNEVLKSMKRLYSIEEFKKIVKAFREKIPNITLATDIICGFPGESKDQFNESVALVKGLMPDVLNISRFRPRPGTDAAKMEQVKSDEIKRRTSLLTSVYEWTAFQQNRKWQNWKGRIIIDGIGKGSTWVGRNSYYKPIVVKGDFRLGDKISVIVEEITKFHLLATPYSQVS